MSGMYIFTFASFQNSIKLMIKESLGINTKVGEKSREDISNKITESKKQMDEG